MFALRRIPKTGEVEYNIDLGEEYAFVEKVRAISEFERIFRELFDKGPGENTDIYAFVVDDKGEGIPLYKGDWHYIVTDSGKTFSNLSYREPYENKHKK